MKFNVLIVDDEYYICEGLKKILKSFNIKEIGEIWTCYSGEDALNLCQTFKPQLVLTDIKMPGINGVELIRQLNKFLYPVRFLVLSGYDDYEYVRSAFQNGAVDYLLKPVIPEQFNKLILQQVKLLQEVFFSNIDQPSRAETIQFSRHFFTAITHSEYTSEAAPWETELCKYLPNKYYCFCIIACSQEGLAFIHAIINHIYDYFKEQQSEAFLCADVPRAKIVLLLNYNQKCPDLSPLWSIIQKTSMKTFHTETAFAVSRSGTLLSLPALYYEAENRLTMRLIEGYGKIYDFPLPPGQKKLKKVHKLIASLFHAPALIDSSNLWEQLCIQLQKLNATDLKYFYNYFVSLLRCHMLDNNIVEDTEQIPSFYDFLDYTELEFFLQHYFRKYSSRYPRHLKKQTNIEYIKEYIDNNFTNNITLKEVADLHFISSSHLSKLFHSKYNITFHDYIVYRRMTYAEHLLHDPVLSIQEIASMTGYDNAFNFSRAFKNYFGVSPSHYRNQ